MCGIIGYIGNRQALPILIQGLKRLEYRGYDSVGVAILADHKITNVKTVGRIENLEKKVENLRLSGTVGIAHTRWATHGGVTEANAHPHWGCDEGLVIVHNGIIENYRELKNGILKNHKFKSETDTEILAHLIEHFYQDDLRLAVEKALKKARGTYGIVALHQDQPGKIVVARLGSPLVIGVGDKEYFIASDTSPMLAYTKNVIFLNDGEIAEVSRNAGIQTFNLKSEKIIKDIEYIDWDDAQAQKHGYDHFMLKEIFDQSMVYEDAIRGRVDLAEGTARLGGLNMTVKQMRQVDKIILLACGTAYYAAQIGKYVFERLARIPTEVEVASEFRYRDPIIDKNTLVFVISQSGETADTLAALREAKRRGAWVRGIVNVIGSTIARETDGGTYIHAGPELAVASTKAYTNMVAILILYALQFGRSRGLSLSTGQRLIKALLEIPEKMKQILARSDQIKKIAEKYTNFTDALYLGRGINYPVALEGSHKLKEISYIHSEGYPAGEMKHGVNALLSEELFVVGLMTKNQLYDKMRSNLEEVKARQSSILLLATAGDKSAEEISSDIIYVPETMELLEPLLNIIPLQLFAYHMAVILGKDVDRPRNLAKSVTVE